MVDLAVTGATGRVGGGVARALADAGLATRLVVRDPARAPQLPGSEVAAAEYQDDAAVRSALEGIETVFMVSATEAPDRLDQHRSFVEAAVAAGVRRIVYLSFYGAASDATFTFARDHFHTERAIVESGLEWTFLRDNLYLDFVTHFADENGVIRGPAGDGRYAGVAIRDVVECATIVLRGPERYAATTYSLTGPEALTMTEIARRVTELGRPTTFQNETVEEAYASRAHYGAEPWEVDGWVSTYLAIAAGELEPATDDVQSLTGHAPAGLVELFGR